MRWISDPNPDPDIGDLRTVSRFLWLPLTLMHGSVLQTRWLERADIEQEYGSECFICSFRGCGSWINKRFVNIKEERLKNV